MPETTQLSTFFVFLARMAAAASLLGCSQSIPVSSNSATDAIGHALSVSGTPTPVVVAGIKYVFRPTSNLYGGSVIFSIENKPAWAAFDKMTGALTGTPTLGDIGESGGVVISATDGVSDASIGPFSIVVTASGNSPSLNATGFATLSWVAPSTNTDGTRFANIAGFHVHYGTAAADLNRQINVPGPLSTTYTVKGLAAGTYFFAVTAYTSAGTDGPESVVASKTLR